MRLARSIYTEDGKLLLSAGQLLKNDYINNLHKKGFTSLYIGEIPSDIELPEVVSEKVRYQATRAVHDSITAIKKTGRFDRKRVIQAVDAIIEELLQEKDLIVNILDLKSTGDYTFRHSVNVCILSLIIGRSMFYYKDKLRELGVGSLLHDIGKSLIPDNILNKKGRLTNEEFEEIKKHSRLGYDLLLPFKNMNLLSRHISYQHHERYDGSGYPRGLEGDSIIEYARIVAIVDCYDAMTSDRVYRTAMMPADAIKEIAHKSKDQYDPKIIKIFLRSVAPYPVGVKVVLNTGQEAIVLKINPKDVVRPVIALLKNHNSISNNGHDILKRIDMLEDESLEIVKASHGSA